jgi:YihY family inner membrane protein
MSTATVVPETWDLTGDDAMRTLRTTGRVRLLKDAFLRMRFADGFSHARSLAFMTSLVLVQGTIVIVGTASAVGDTGFSRGIVSAIQNAVPGPAGQVLTTAVHHAHSTGASRRYLALALGLVGALVAGTTAMGQLERGLNRIYGVEQDRPTRRKYGLAFLLAVTAGVLISVAFVAVGFGFEVGDALHNEGLNQFWTIVRWPLALVLMVAAMAVLFQRCPRRRQPGWTWLAFGSVVSVFLWFAITLVMGLVFRLSKSFGTTYGPLAGIVALQMWAMLSAMALLYGGAVAAQLEAVRAGARKPQDEDKVADSEPESAPALVSVAGAS